jgi:NTE family protein
MPGLFTPVKFRDRWMLDGGLVNPVPVSACRALGADVVIAVNLNAQMVGTHLSRTSRQQAETEEGTTEERSFWRKMTDYFSAGEGKDPSFFDVIASSVNIMQDRITRSRMAGDPAEITLVPMLDDFALMDFHRAKQAIEEGRRQVQANADSILMWVGSAMGAKPDSAE